MLRVEINMFLSYGYIKLKIFFLKPTNFDYYLGTSYNEFVLDFRIQCRYGFHCIKKTK